MPTSAYIALFAACLTLVAAQPPPPPPASLQVWYSATHQDNAVVATPAAVASLDASYAYYGDNLFVLPAAPGLVPLNLYANPATSHHLTCASPVCTAWAAANGYALVGPQGFVYPTAEAAGPNAQPFEVWYSVQRGDRFLVGTDQHRADAKGAGYTLLWTDSYMGGVQWVAWQNQAPQGVPFPPSQDLVGFQYQLFGNAVTPGIGADTWYPSWASNDLMYSSWTDGVVDGVRSGSGGGAHAITGFATITGSDPFNLTLSNVATYAESALPYEGR